MTAQTELDPIEKMMIARMADFFISNIDYDLYHNPQDWFKEVRFWRHIARMADGEQYFDPAKFNNGNFQYDPREGVFDLLRSIKINKRERFPEVLQFIIEKLKLVGWRWFSTGFSREKESYSEDEKISTLNRYLSVFSLSLDADAKLTTAAGMQREDDRLMVFGFLNGYPDEKTSFIGAFERFVSGGTDAFRQSLTSCRTLIENLTKKLSGEATWENGLSKLVKSNTRRDVIKKIYSYLSAYGDHGQIVPTQHDTELGLKLTEDVVVWLIKHYSVGTAKQ